MASIARSVEPTGGQAWAVFLLAAWLAAVMPGSTLAAPEADLWPRWQAHDPAAEAVIDHSAWAGFLSRHLEVGEDGINRVAYGAVTAVDRQSLAGYVEELAALSISRYGRDEQIAYWANLYNALTLLVVLDHYPVGSIREINISPGWFARGPWGAKLVTVEGEALSLDDIEHRIMRPIWQDPRIHYMVNCAALGCPNLLPEPFTGDRWDTQADDAARDFINHPRGVRVEGDATAGGRLGVSSIYHWYRQDFGGDDAGVIAHLRVHAEGDLAQSLGSITRVHRHDYDWALNAAPSDGS